MRWQKESSNIARKNRKHTAHKQLRNVEVLSPYLSCSKCMIKFKDSCQQSAQKKNSSGQGSASSTNFAQKSACRSNSGPSQKLCSFPWPSTSYFLFFIFIVSSHRVDIKVLAIDQLYPVVTRTHTLAQKYLIELLMWNASNVHKQSSKV